MSTRTLADMLADTDRATWDHYVAEYHAFISTLAGDARANGVWCRR